MDKQEQPVHTDHSLTEVLLAGEAVAALASNIPTDSATVNSDAAVGGSVGGGSGERQRRPSSAAATPEAVVAGSGGLTASNVAAVGKRSGGKNHHINSYARQRHYRKRALSTAGFSSGTTETSGSMADVMAANDEAGQRDASGSVAKCDGANLSRTLMSPTLGSNMMTSGAENSIVSFGLNFDFDGTSSPSNSDSGEVAANDGKGGEGSSEDDNNGNADGKGPTATNNGALTGNELKTMGEEKKNNVKTPSPNNKNHIQSIHIKCKGESGSNEGKNSKGSSSKNSEAKRHTRVKFDPNANVPPATNEGSGSSMSSSDSSGGSNSGNGGSSGGRSTVSSLTTSSNQEWMVTNESAEAAVQASDNTSVEVSKPLEGGQATGGNGVTDLTTKEKDAVSGKKRKKVTISMAATPENNGGASEKNKNAKGDEGGNEEDDGYKTDEEQWGGNRNAAIDGSNQGGSGCLPGQVGMATHKGSLLKASSSSKKTPNSNGSNKGPPMKQARFSMDCEQHPIHEHPENVQSADASAQPLSSLSGSDSAIVPSVTIISNVGQTQGLLSNSSGTPAMSSSNPSNSSGLVPIHAASALKQISSYAVHAVSGPDKRKERNAREKERSCRIAKQIDDLRALLSRGGVTVSKGTKSSVLSEAASYINILQQQQVQWELDRQALLQQMQQIGITPNPTTGQQNVPQIGQNVAPQAALPQHMALSGGGAQQGVALPVQQGGVTPDPIGQSANGINTNDYKFIFSNSSVGMAIASLGGAFVDCNPIFCQLSEYTKEEVCAMTIFNMTSRQDLQHAFDLISQMITPTLDANAADKGEDDKSSIVLRGAMKQRGDLGLSVSLIKGDHGIAKCFCVTLVKILSIEATRPDTVSIEMELPQVWSTKQQTNVGFGASPAYTAG